jgi:pimeloyl-ACP methyl ester carboxylesterase
MKRWLITLLLGGFVGACGSEPDPSDPSDTSSSSLSDITNSVDGGLTDVAEVSSDGAAAQDTSTADTPASDLGSEAMDVDSTIDAEAHGGVWSLQVPCSNKGPEIYTLTAADVDTTQPAGTVVGCVLDGVIPPEKVAQALQFVGLEGTGGIEMRRITYLTKRSFGEVALATARVLLPDTPPEGPASVVVVTHGTAGLADQCAPSRVPIPHVMGIPFAGTDTVVVLPDYAGLGNEGVQGYHDSHDTAYSVLDSLKAVHDMLDPALLSKTYAVMGHSQGGAAALYAQGLANEYAADFDLEAVVAFSPGWTSSAIPDKSLYATPQYFPVTLGAGVPMAALAFSHYADAYNHVDAADPGLYFSDEWRETIVDWIETECVSTIAANFMELGDGLTAMDIFDPVFLMVSLSCLQGEAGCTEPTQSHIERRKAHYIPMDVAGAPALIIQGMADKQTTPAKAACKVKAMKEGGFTPSVSVDPLATHFDVVKLNLGLAVAWIKGHVNETMLPTWSFDAAVLPACD